MNIWHEIRQRWGRDLGRIVRFGITGGISTFIHYAAYLLALLWIAPTAAYTVGYGVALCFNYILTTFFTFKEHPTKKNVAGFIASHIVNYILEIGILNLFLYLGVEKRLAGIVVLIVVVPINFLLLRFVFVNKK